MYRADWVLPISADPIPGGWVAVDAGKISRVGSGVATGASDLGRAAILPALVNAHTHLELSYLRGIVRPAERLLDWIRALMAERRAFPDAADPAILRAARAGIAEARATGTGLVGDVGNTLATVPLLRDVGVPARVFFELFGFDHPDPAAVVREARTKIRQSGGSDTTVQISLAAHAPYSVSPALLAAIRADLDSDADGVSSVHLAESLDEVEFIAHGTGAWPGFLRELGVWNEAWRPPGVSPVDYLVDCGFLDSRVLAVHGVQCSWSDLARLRALGATIVSCPRSNRYVGAGDPPLEAFYAMGVRVAFGTDSLASVENLNMFTELAAARRIAPRVPPRDLLKSATLFGARALGFDDFGSLEQGARAALIAVRLPEGIDDVEEYLVSGVEPENIQWLDSADCPVASRPVAHG
jgi:cytosine/adenosine deaminase-related metal-dependent hydrolase